MSDSSAHRAPHEVWRRVAVTAAALLGTQNLVPVVVAVLAAMAALTDPTPVTAE